MALIWCFIATSRVALHMTYFAWVFKIVVRNHQLSEPYFIVFGILSMLFIPYLWFVAVIGSYVCFLLRARRDARVRKAKELEAAETHKNAWRASWAHV